MAKRSRVDTSCERPEGPRQHDTAWLAYRGISTALSFSVQLMSRGARASRPASTSERSETGDTGSDSDRAGEAPCAGWLTGLPISCWLGEGGKAHSSNGDNARGVDSLSLKRATGTSAGNAATSCSRGAGGACDGGKQEEKGTGVVGGAELIALVERTSRCAAEVAERVDMAAGPNGRKTEISHSPTLLLVEPA